MAYQKVLVGSVVVLCTLLLAFTGCSEAEGLKPALVLEKAYDATATDGITSFHFTLSFAVTAESMGEISASEPEGGYLATDLAWTKQEDETGVREQIIIGN